MDTSLAIPILMSAHEAHAHARVWASGRVLGLSGHALIETYSVLTRLPGDARLAPADAAELIDSTFTVAVALSTDAAESAHRVLARLGVTGGAVYDGLVALAAQEHGEVLATRDLRARSTYERVGVDVELVLPGGGTVG